MSRSKRKPVFKEGSGKRHKILRRVLRSSFKNYFRSNKQKFIDGEINEFPNSKTIVNDYTYCDYRYVGKENSEKDIDIKLSRK